MRNLILLLFTCYSASSFAQSVQGTVVDENSTPVSYVNIGIPGSQGGTLSDAAGRFELSLPDSLSGDLNVAFSHLSYITAERSVSELRGLGSHGGRLEVTMSPRAVDIEQVMVRPDAKVHRYVKRGIPAPGYAILTYKEDDSNWGEEIGSRLNVESRVRVSKIRFTVSSNTFDKLKVRINVYKTGLGTDEPQNILNNPVYYDILRDKKRQKIEIVPVDDIVLEQGEYLFTLEFVEGAGEEGSARFPIFWHKSYTRDRSMARFEDIPINIGMSVEGAETGGRNE